MQLLSLHKLELSSGEKGIDPFAVNEVITMCQRRLGDKMRDLLTTSALLPGDVVRFTYEVEITSAPNVPD